MIEPHPAALLLPRIVGAEFDALVDSIRRDGLDQPGEVDKATGLLLDGINRQNACEAAGVPFETVTVDLNGTDPVDYVIRRNVRRRKQLTASQRAISAAESWPLVGGKPKRGGDKTKQRALTFAQLAARWEIGETLLREATALVERDPDAAAAVKAGASRLDEAYRALLKRERDLRSAEASLDGLRDRHPDLAELASGEALTLSEALAAGRERDEQAREERQTRTYVLAALVSAGKPPDHASRYAEVYDPAFDELSTVTPAALREVAEFASRVAAELEGRAVE